MNSIAEYRRQAQEKENGRAAKNMKVMKELQEIRRREAKERANKAIPIENGRNVAVPEYRRLAQENYDQKLSTLLLQEVSNNNAVEMKSIINQVRAIQKLSRQIQKPTVTQEEIARYRRQAKESSDELYNRTLPQRRERAREAEKERIETKSRMLAVAAEKKILMNIANKRNPTYSARLRRSQRAGGEVTMNKWRRAAHEEVNLGLTYRTGNSVIPRSTPFIANGELSESVIASNGLAQSVRTLNAAVNVGSNAAVALEATKLTELVNKNLSLLQTPMTVNVGNIRLENTSAVNVGNIRLENTSN
jgi:hypothetical protein